MSGASKKVWPWLIRGASYSQTWKFPITQNHHMKFTMENQAGNAGYGIKYSWLASKFWSLFSSVDVNNQGSKFGIGTDIKFGNKIETRQTLSVNSTNWSPSLSSFISRELDLGFDKFDDYRFVGFLETTLGDYSTVPELTGGLSIFEENLNRLSLSTSLSFEYISSSIVVSKPFSNDNVLVSLGFRPVLNRDNIVDFAIFTNIRANISKTSYVEFMIRLGPSGFGIDLTINRWGQEFKFPLTFFGYKPLAMVISGIATSFALMVFKFWIQRIHKLQFDEKLQRKRQNLEHFRKKAEKWTEGMKNSVEQQRQIELEKQGLVITRASYGNLQSTKNFPGPINMTLQDNNTEPELITFNEEIIDVTDPLQFQVDKSQLHLPAESKCSLPGFYDPCTGQPNYLDVLFNLSGQNYRTIVPDKAALHIPEARESGQEEE